MSESAASENLAGSVRPDQPKQPILSESISETGKAPRPSRQRTWKHRVITWVCLLTIIYAGVCLTFVWMESRLVFPGAYMEAGRWLDLSVFEPDDPIVGDVSTFTYEAVNGTKLFGRLYVRQDAVRVVLFLHGNGIRATDLDGWTRRLSDTMNATVLTAEYRGFQNDDFTPSDESTFEDAESAITALSKATGAATDEITIYGRSLGGGVAAGLVSRLATRNQSIRSLILDRTFNSVADVGSAMFPWLPVKLLVRNRFDSVDNLADYDGVVVQIHGRPDRIVPMVNGKRLFDSLRTKRKRWIEVADLHHNDRMSKETLTRMFKELRELEGEH